MLTLALAALLTVDDELPISPPPLVPALPEPPRTPLPAPPVRHAPADEAPAPPQESQSTSDNDEGFNGTRVAVTTGVAGAVSAALVGGALYYAFSTTDSSGSGAVMLVLSLPAALFLGTGLAFAAHRAMGGLGSWGAHLGGGAIGGGLVLLATVAAATQLHDTPGVAAIAGWTIASGAIFGLATALMGELSHVRSVAEAHPGIALVPTRGGAVATVGFGF
jgi:hypothetical protein